jgi:hypothetical protein
LKNYKRLFLSGLHYYFQPALRSGEVKIILEISPKKVRMTARQSSGVRGSSFTAMNAGISSEAAFRGRLSIFSEPAHGFLV